MTSIPADQVLVYPKDTTSGNGIEQLGPILRVFSGCCGSPLHLHNHVWTCGDCQGLKLIGAEHSDQINTATHTITELRYWIAVWGGFNAGELTVEVFFPPVPF